MHIEIGKYYVNKTWRFLLPCLREHGDIFTNKFNFIFKLAVGIHDTLTDGSTISNGRSIYLLCDKLASKINFEEFLNFIREQKYYIADYCPDSEILKSRKHMIVINIPETFYNAYDQFLKGNYSLMYSEQELKLLFSSNLRKKEYDILSKNPEIVSEFAKEVNNEFGTKAIADDFKNSELELPLKKTEEIFNCCDNNNNNIFFNEQIDKVWQL
jgi:hypothetical protein